MIKILRNSEFANKFKHEIYPFVYTMRYIEAGKNSIIQLKYSISNRLVAIAECSYKNDKLLKLIIRSVEPGIVELFINLYSVRIYSYVFVYNYYAQDSYYTDIIRAYKCGNQYMNIPKNTNSVKLYTDNIYFIDIDDTDFQNISGRYRVIIMSFSYYKYWEQHIKLFINPDNMLVVEYSIYFHDRILNNLKNDEIQHNIILFLESLNKKVNMKSARKSIT